MLSAVTDALSNFISILALEVRSFFGTIIGNPFTNTDYRNGGFGTLILSFVAVSVVFFALRAIIKMIWGR